jgi:hypothetical protein
MSIFTLMKTTAAQRSAIAKMVVGTRVRLPHDVARVTSGATTGHVICNGSKTARGWREGGQVQMRWDDGIIAWEPVGVLRDGMGVRFY